MKKCANPCFMSKNTPVNNQNPPNNDLYKNCKTQCGNLHCVRSHLQNLCVLQFINVDLILDYKKNKTNSTQL